MLRASAPSRLDRPASHRMVRRALAATLLACAAWLSPAHADPAPAPGSPLDGGIAEMAVIPGGEWRAVRVTGDDALYFISGNGRWVVKGRAYDLWAGQDLADFEAVRASTRTVALQGLGRIWDDLAPIVFGQGETGIIVFVDPACPHCEALIHDLRRHEAAYRFLVLQIPLMGPDSGRAVQALHCAEDEDAARAALLAGERGRRLRQKPSCDLAPLQRRLVTAQLIGLRGVPFMVHAGDGRFVEGRPDDLGRWLSGGSEARP